MELHYLIIKPSCFLNRIFSHGLRGRFALGTVSETQLEDAIFEINVLGKSQFVTNSKLPNL